MKSSHLPSHLNFLLLTYHHLTHLLSHEMVDCETDNNIKDKN